MEFEWFLLMLHSLQHQSTLKAATMHFRTVSHTHYVTIQIKQTFCHRQHSMLRKTHTQRLEDSKGFLGRMLLFIQFLSSFYYYYPYSTTLNSNQHT